MKKIFLSLICVISFMFGCYNTSDITMAETDYSYSYYEYYDNGYYAEITVNINYLDFPNAINSVTSGSKTYDFKNSSNQILWSYTIYGTFSYNGTTATCTNDDDSYSIYDSNWHMDNHSHYKSGNTAYGSATMKKKVLGITVDTYTANLSLTCRTNGTLY